MKFVTRRYTLTTCKAGHTSLFCPELPRRGWLLMSTVWCYAVQKFRQLSDILHLNNKNNQLTRRAQPPEMFF